MPRFKILQVFSRYQQFGGEEGSVYRIGDALHENNDVEYFVKSTANLLSGSILDKVMVPWRTLHNLDAAWQLRRMQEIGHFDIWLVHNVFPALSPSVYDEAFRLNVPIVHYLHNYRFFCTNGLFLDHEKPCQLCAHGNYLHALKAACWRDSHLVSGWMGVVLSRVRLMNAYQRISRFIAISEAQKAVHVGLGFPEDRIDVVHHFFEAKGLPTELPDKGYALFLGRLSAEKGGADLLEAWRRMPADRELVIAGDGPDLPGLKRFAETHGLTNVRFAGFVPKEDQDELWRGAAFLVVPSIWMEPFGMVVLEAWSRGRPVVAYSIGALPELVTHEKTGLLAPPHRPEELAAAMERLLGDREMQRAMAAQGRAEVDTHFTKARWTAQIQESFAKATKFK